MNTSYQADIERNVSLAPFTTMAVPALAAYYACTTSTQALQAAVEFAKCNKLPWMVLGEGSNTLFRGDYSGLIIHNRINGIERLDSNSSDILLNIGAGENWHDLVAHCVQQGWHGIENLALIPGTVGAAPIQNIGAYGVELTSVFESLVYFDTETNELHELNRSQCEFGYRDSIFKHRLRDRAIIVSVVLRLRIEAPLQLDYQELKNTLAEKTDQPNINDVFETICAIRRRKLPDPEQIPNSGSFFKNPVVSKQRYADLKQRYPNLVGFPVIDGVKLAAAWLIEQAGWKQKAIDDVVVHPQQALVITNPEQKSGGAVYQYAKLIQEDVKARYGVELEIEPRVI